MTIIITIIIFLLTTSLSRYLFKKWFNHLFLYVSSWSLFIILYEIRLINYIQISSETWYIIFVTFIGFVAGTITVFSARSSLGKNNFSYKKSSVNSFLMSSDLKLMKILIIICSLVGLISAIQHWYLLISKFGNIETVLIRANLIYRMRVAGELDETIPYLHSIAYAGVFLSGIYTAYKNKFTLLASLPLIAVIIKDVASVGRGGMFIGFLLFIISFFLQRHKLSENNFQLLRNQKGLIISGIAVLIIILGSLTFVKEIRASVENYKGQTRSLGKLKDLPIISPSIYLYLSANVGVLSKYFDTQGEAPMIGESTFLPLYNLLAKFGFVEKPPVYPRGYNVPVWSNAATYLRDLHADFGLIGLFFIPFLLSLITTHFWFRFFQTGDFISLVILAYLNVIIAFSVFYLITRAAFWLLSLLFLLIVISAIERVKDFNSRAILQKIT